MCLGVIDKRLRGMRVSGEKERKFILKSANRYSLSLFYSLPGLKKLNVLIKIIMIL